MCAVRTSHTMGVLMQNHTASSVRRHVTALGMLVVVGLFSIGSASAATTGATLADQSTSTSTTTDTLSPNGVFGWD